MKEPHFRTAAVVGAGTMGRGIAQVMAGAGLTVHLIEVNDEAAQAAYDGISRELDREIAKWGMTKGEKGALLKRIRATSNVQDAAGVDVVVEAISEDMAGKQALWRVLEPLAPTALGITHTGTLSISEIARAMDDPQRLIGMHFLPPAHRVKLVEIVRGLQTSEATLAAARSLAQMLGKTPIEVVEYPGYVTSRVIVPLLNEAMHALMEGVASAQDIDTAMRLGFQMELGPLALADRIGLDQVMKWMTSLYAELGSPQFRPCPLLRKMVRAGHLGVKTGRGFHVYPVEP